MDKYRRVSAFRDTGCTSDGTGLVLTLMMQDGAEIPLNFSITMGQRFVAELLGLFQHASLAMSEEDLCRWG